jgi:hypothetical protein
MQIIGVVSIALFLAGLAVFMLTFLNQMEVRTGTLLGGLFLVIAWLLLAVTIKKRSKTERT